MTPAKGTNRDLLLSLLIIGCNVRSFSPQLLELTLSQVFKVIDSCVLVVHDVLFYRIRMTFFIVLGQCCHRPL